MFIIGGDDNLYQGKDFEPAGKVTPCHSDMVSSTVQSASLTVRLTGLVGKSEGLVGKGQLKVGGPRQENVGGRIQYIVK